MARGPAKDARKYSRAEFSILEKCFKGKTCTRDGVEWSTKLKAYKQYNSRKRQDTNYKLTDCAKDFGISQAVLTRWMKEINEFHDLSDYLFGIAREHAATKGSSSSTEHPEIRGILFHLRTVPNVLFDDLQGMHSLWRDAWAKLTHLEKEIRKLREKAKKDSKITPEKLRNLAAMMEKQKTPELPLHE